MAQSQTEKPIRSNYSKKEIQEELNRILNSDLFSRSPVLSLFLKYIVEETLEGNAHNIKEYTIAVNALGKFPGFDPQINAVVRINAGRLRRLLNEYYCGQGAKDIIKIEIVKGTYVPMFRKQLTQSNSQTLTTEEHNIPSNSAGYSRSKLTLCILPFRNLCADNEYQFFVDGFGEELTRIFSTSEEIAVVAHFSALKYAKRFDDIRLIGAELGVHYVIMGSVKRSSKNISVSVGLVETMNGLQIWSKDYKHSLENNPIMDIQDQINNDVFAILSGHFGFIINDTMRLVGADLKQDLHTFDAILWYHHSQITNSEEDFTQSRKALEKILETDPNNAMCLTVLCDTYLCSYGLGYPTVDDPVNTANKLIKKALHIAPLSQYAHLIHGWTNIYLGNKKEAIEALEYGLQLVQPSPSTMGACGFALACAGEYKRGHALLKEALSLNPFCPWWYNMGFYFGFYDSENYEEALKYAYKMNASADVYLIPLLISAAKGQLNRKKEAVADVQLLNENFTEILSHLKIYLSAFILDELLVDKIILGAKKAGVAIA